MEAVVKITENPELPLPISIPTDEDTEMGSSNGAFPGYPFMTWDELIHGDPIRVHTMEGGTYVAPYAAVGVDGPKGDPTLYVTPDETQDVYAYKLMSPEPEEKEEEAPNQKEISKELLIFTERMWLDPHITKAMQQLPQLGIQADILRLRQLPEKERALDNVKAQVQRMEQFVKAEWSRYFAEQRALRQEYEDVTLRLHRSGAAKQVQELIKFPDELSYLQPPQHQTGLVAEGWKHLYQQQIYSDGKGPEERVPGWHSHGKASAGLSRKCPGPQKANTQCRYCSQKGTHFQYECPFPHRWCNVASARVCVVPHKHMNYEPKGQPICSYGGEHSRITYEAKVKAGTVVQDQSA